MMCWLRYIVVLLLGIGFLASVEGQQTSPAPGSAKEWSALGVKLFRGGDQIEAVAAFSRAIELRPDFPETYLNRALAYLKLEEWRKAESDCTSAIALDADNARGFQHRAIARSQLGEHDSAFQDASRAARMEPADSNVVFTRYLMCSRLGRHDLGHFAGESYIGLQSWSDPWSPYLALLNHVSLRRAGLEEKARAILNEAMQWLDSKQWPMPVVIYLAGDIDEKTLMEQASTRDMQTIAHYYVGAKAWLDGDPAAATIHFEWVRDQGNEEFLQNMLARDHLAELVRGSP